MKEILYWGEFQHNEGTFILTASQQGLCFVTLPNQSFQSTRDWAKRYASECTLVHDDWQVAPYVAQLKAYLEGHRETFDIPTDPRGTEFQKTVWRALRDIPFGETRTYGEIGSVVQRSDAVRAVGAAIGANPIPPFFPCHRVIGKNGSLTGYRGGLKLKAWLLEMETRDQDGQSKLNTQRIP